MASGALLDCFRQKVKTNTNKNKESKEKKTDRCFEGKKTSHNNYANKEFVRLYGMKNCIGHRSAHIKK